MQHKVSKFTGQGFFLLRSIFKLTFIKWLFIWAIIYVAIGVGFSVSFASYFSGTCLGAILMVVLYEMDRGRS